jgi:hypothetical protein
MIDTALMVIVVGTLVVAIAVDLGVLIDCLRRCCRPALHDQGIARKARQAGARHNPSAEKRN